MLIPVTEHTYIYLVVSFHFQRQNEDNVNGLKQELDTYKGKRVVSAFILKVYLVK